MQTNTFLCVLMVWSWFFFKITCNDKIFVYGGSFSNILWNGDIRNKWLLRNILLYVIASPGSVRFWPPLWLWTTGITEDKTTVVFSFWDSSLGRFLSLSSVLKAVSSADQSHSHQSFKCWERSQWNHVLSHLIYAAFSKVGLLARNSWTSSCKIL